MKRMIASDIHGSTYYCKKLLDAFDREGAEQLILLGDILFHGPQHEKPEGYDPKETAAMLNRYAGNILAVMGNCDVEMDQSLVDFKMTNDVVQFHSEGMPFACYHGNYINPHRDLAFEKGTILFSGHSHHPEFRKTEGMICANPGSVAYAEDGAVRSYLILENKQLVWKDLDGNPFRWENL